jgi:hypothetical protein
MAFDRHDHIVQRSRKQSQLACTARIVASIKGCTIEVDCEGARRFSSAMRFALPLTTLHLR